MNLRKLDPSRTTTLRRAFMVEMRRRFRALARDITELVVELDVFGLSTRRQEVFFQALQVNVERQAWRFMTSDKKLGAFQAWFKGQVDARAFTTTAMGVPWTAEFVESAYRRGLAHSWQKSYVKKLGEPLDFTQGSREQFLKSSFTQPEMLSKARLLSLRTFEELKGVTATMGQQMSRVLSDGLLRGENPRTIARGMRRSIDSLTRTRALTIARTEVIHAHAEGTLDGFERLGVEKVGVEAEWSTAGDERVCEECAMLEGVVMTTKEARGLLPRHPNCRCAWLPADKARKQPGQKWLPSEKQAAIKRSLRAEYPGKTWKEASRRSSWLGKEAIVVPKPVVPKPVIPKPVPTKPKPERVFSGEIDQKVLRQAVAAANLTPSEVEAVWTWSEGVLVDLVRAYQKMGRPLPGRVNVSGLTKDLIAAAKKLPQYEGKIYRGLTLWDVDEKAFQAMFKVGNKIDTSAFASWSRSQDVAGQYAKGRKGHSSVILKWKDGRGALIETTGVPQYAYQQEVLVSAGAEMRVVSFKRTVGDLWEVVVERVAVKVPVKLPVLKPVVPKPVPKPSPPTVRIRKPGEAAPHIRAVLPKGSEVVIKSGVERVPAQAILNTIRDLESRLVSKHLPVKFVAKPTMAEKGVVGVCRKTTERGVKFHQIEILADVKRPANPVSLRLGSWSLDNSVAGGVRHEFGHAVYDAGTVEGRTQWIKLYEGQSKSAWKKGVSEYGSTTSKELFAEAFSAWTHPEYGLSGVKRLPGEIEEIMQRYVKRPELLKR